MSFYGNIKRVDSSPFVFDRYYPSRADMEQKLANKQDNVYVGRYVLIRYDWKDRANSNDDELEFFEKYQKNADSTLSLTKDYKTNEKRDADKYSQSFNGTVWQKVYTTIAGTTGSPTPTEKYIMVAELNADAPHMDLDIISPKKLVTTNKEEWNQPSVNKSTTTEDTFVVTMPNILHLNVGDIAEDFYGKDLLSPKERGQFKEEAEGKTIDPFSDDYNYIKWINISYQFDEDGNPKSSAETKVGENIDEKKLDMKLYGFGKAISNMYDALYGVPVEGTGNRPYFDDDSSSWVTPENKGLVGILNSIASENKGDLSQDGYGRDLKSGMHYYFTSRWNSVEEDSSNFIENIPEVIGASAEFNSGSSAKSKYYINFNAAYAEDGVTNYITSW